MSNNAQPKNTYRAELTRFLTMTSLKGVARAVKTPEPWLRNVWVTAVVIFLGVTVYNTYSLTHQYLMFKSGTKIVEKSVDFIQDTGSDVMLCNINPFSREQLNKTMVLTRQYRLLVRNWTNTEDNTTLREIRQELLSGQMGFYQHIGPSAASGLGHRLHSFMLSCYIHFLDGVMERKIPCSQSSLKIKRIVHREYFNCYIIYGENTKGSRPSTGLSFLLYVDDHRDSEVGQDISIQHIGKGALLTIGERGTFLDPDSKGVEIIPNMVNVVRFRQNARKRLQAPHGNCQDRKTISNLLKEEFTMPYVYTRNACYSACVEYYVVKKCKCQDVGQHGTLKMTFENISTCGSTTEGRDVMLERMKCVQKLRNQYRLNCLQHCPSPCKERNFHHEVSYLELLPVEVRKLLTRDPNTVPNEITHNATNQNGDAQNSANQKQHHTKNRQIFNNLKLSNIAWVQLKRESNSYYLVEDIAKMTFADYLAKIGGTCNLWSGITVFVLVELLDLLCRLCRKVLSSDTTRGSDCEGGVHYEDRYNKMNGFEAFQMRSRH